MKRMNSREIYSMMEAHGIDLGYAAQLQPARDLIITPLCQEPMLILCTKGSYAKGSWIRIRRFMQDGLMNCYLA